MPCSRIQRRRARATSARCRSAACKLFFEGDVVSAKKPRKRTPAGSNPSLEQLRNDLHQRQVRPFGDQGQYPLRVRFQRRDTSSAWLRRRTPVLVPALHPSDCRTHLTLTSKRSAASRRDTHPFQRLRSRVPAGHQNRTLASPTPEKENQCTKTRSSITLWESHRFKSVGARFSCTNVHSADNKSTSICIREPTSSTITF
jgi:hypothetical protein